MISPWCLYYFFPHFEFAFEKLRSKRHWIDDYKTSICIGLSGREVVMILFTFDNLAGCPTSIAAVSVCVSYSIEGWVYWKSKNHKNVKGELMKLWPHLSLGMLHRLWLGFQSRLCLISSTIWFSVKHKFFL
jgi:hypothetical protein